MTQTELIQGLRNNDTRTQTYFYEQYYPRIKGLLHKKYGEIPFEMMEEVMNSTFLRIFRNIHLLNHDVALTSWCFSLAKNVFNNYIRAERKWMTRGRYTNKPKNASIEELISFTQGPYDEENPHELISADWERDKTPVENNIVTHMDFEIIQKMAKKHLSPKGYDAIMKRVQGYKDHEQAKILGVKRCVISERCNKSILKLKKLNTL